MKLATHHDIVAPVDTIFKVLSDSTRWERAAVRRGMTVNRTDGGRDLAVGAAWAVKASFRGKVRDLTIAVVDVTRPSQIVTEATSALFSANLSVDLIELSARKTRVSISVETKPNTLAARIMLQSAKLAKKSIKQRFDKRVGALLIDLAERISYEV